MSPAARSIAIAPSRGIVAATRALRIPSINDTATAGTAPDAGRVQDSYHRVVPREMADKCRKLIESYHAIYGYVSLPDMLWLSDARDVIECDRDLMRIFRKASKSRGAKRANDSFLQIATAVVALEVLVRDYAGWGKRFPAAKHEAEKLLDHFPQRQRVWLMDLYLFPPLGVRRELANALTPTGADTEI
jgi:hypothetical protein